MSNNVYMMRAEERETYEKRHGIVSACFFDVIRDRMIVLSPDPLEKFEVKMQEVIIFEKCPHLPWKMSYSTKLSGRAIGDVEHLKRDILSEAATMKDRLVSHIAEDFTQTLVSRAISETTTKDELAAMMLGFDEEGEIEITEAFPERETDIYYEVKSAMEHRISQIIQQSHQNLNATFSIRLEMQVIANDTDLDKLFQVFLKPIVKYKVHRRHWMEVETLIEYIFSLIPRGYFLVESEEIIDPREHLPLIMQMLEDNNLAIVQLALRKEVKFYWDDREKDFKLSCDYIVEQRGTLDILQTEAAQNVKQSFEELFFELTNAGNKNVECVRLLLQRGLRTDLRVGDRIELKKLNIRLSPVVKDNSHLFVHTTNHKHFRVLRSISGALTALLLINHKKKVSLKAMKDVEQLRQQLNGALSVCVIDQDSVDVSFLQFCRAFSSSIEVYSCESGVQQIMNSLCSSELYPVMILLDEAGQVLAKEQFYAIDWMQFFTAMKHFVVTNNNITTVNNEGAGNKAPNSIFPIKKSLKSPRQSTMTERVTMKDTRSVSYSKQVQQSPPPPQTLLQPPSGNNAANLSAYRNIKGKFLRELRTTSQSLLRGCRSDLALLSYPVSFELLLISEEVLNFDGTLSEKYVYPPAIHTNLLAEHKTSAKVRQLMKMIDTHRGGSHSGSNHQQQLLRIQKGKECAICEETAIDEDSNQYCKVVIDLGRGGSSRRMLLHYCETCYNDELNREHFLTPFVFLHKQSTPLEVCFEQLGNYFEKMSQASEEDEEDNIHTGVQCIGCEVNPIVATRWICLSCDRSRKDYSNSMLLNHTRVKANCRNEVSLCDQCMHLMKHKQMEERVPDNMGAFLEQFNNFQTHGHQSHHVMLAVPFFHGLNVI